jgi:hypothetical protein
MESSKSELEDISLLLEIAGRCLHRAYKRVDSVNCVGKTAISRAISNSDEALYLVRKEMGLLQRS